MEACWKNLDLTFMRQIKLGFDRAKVVLEHTHVYVMTSATNAYHDSGV